jgi:O-succinylbenzoic acid--CoA ligase
MDSWRLGLTINGQWYDRRDLLAYSSHQIVSVINPWEKEIFRFIINWLSDSSDIVQFSSGTTGKPKEIRLSKVSMMQSARITCDYLKLREGHTSLLCMPVDFIAGRMMIIRSMVGGLNLLIIEPKSIPLIDTLPPIDFAAMVPLQVLNLLICRNDLGSIKKLLIGGAEISSELENLLKNVSTEIYATYGMTETASHIALRKLNGSVREKSYHALPGVNISVDNRGCLIITAPWLINPIKTNDLVELSGTTSFRWLGRFDNLINSGGIKIVPEEVEAIVAEKTGKECVAIGIPDPKLGQKLVFVLEGDQLTGSPETLKSEFDNILPRRWKPKSVVLVPKFPRNEALKVDRRKLARMI